MNDQMEEVARMQSFTFGSPEFEEMLSESAHVTGEVRMLQSIAERGMVALDVGANRGVTTVTIAKAVGDAGEVWAFEPVPEYFDALRVNLRSNAVENTRAYRLALSDRNGGVALYKHGGGSGVVPAEDAERLPVPATTVDEFVATRAIEAVDVLSADCEGSELRLFEGAANTLRRDGPAIFCEIHHGYLDTLGLTARKVADYLAGLGYTVRPLRVEDLDGEAAIDECTHIHAWRHR